MVRVPPFTMLPPFAESAYPQLEEQGARPRGAPPNVKLVPPAVATVQLPLYPVGAPEIVTDALTVGFNRLVTVTVVPDSLSFVMSPGAAHLPPPPTWLPFPAGFAPFGFV
jgi:hypothetical protein